MNIAFITRNALVGALLAVFQVALSAIPNTELVTPSLICYTLVFGAEGFAAALVFALLEILIWGLGMWNIAYLYVWPILAAAVLISRRCLGNRAGQLYYSVLAGLYGLMFGALCALMYLPVSLHTAYVWWLAGLRFDLWHGISNLLMTIVCYRPLVFLFGKLKQE